MPSLSVHDFSCIRLAEFELTPMTVVIGPQASGKSLLAKMFYFFVDAIQDQYSGAERGESIRPFLRGLGKRFKETFPPNAWGDGLFQIQFTSGELTLKVERKPAANRLSSEVIVTSSAAFERQFTAYFSAVQRVNRRSRDDEDPFSASFSPQVWDLRRSAMRRLIDNLKSEYVEGQLFVPAGRSFYTNLGKAVAMFEFGSQLDEVTKRFGRRFTSMLDRNPQYFLPEKIPARTKDFLKSQKAITESILGGKLKLSAGDKHLETRDGRIVPLSMMSSGQQELLPLLLALQAYTGANAEDKDPSVDLLYIEEPEAHLFPSAQSAVITHIASVMNFLRTRSRLLITTHSPYVLATLNNLAKAHSVAARYEDRAAEVAKAIPRQSWIPPGALSAYAIDQGVLKPIKDETGLIDGDYLDQISQHISADFMTLLEIEVRE
jgi:hypothetical protein